MNTYLVGVEYPEIITKKDNITIYQGCIMCKSILGSIETIRRTDGKILQLITCAKCKFKWKELWGL